MKITDIENSTDIACECGKHWRPVLYVDWEHGTVEILGKHESDTSWTFRQHHGHEDSYQIDGVDAVLLRDGLEEIAPLIAAASEQYESYWDGSNHVARFRDEDEQRRWAIRELGTDIDDYDNCARGRARAAIQELVEGLRSHGQVGYWDAAEWYQDTAAEAHGITAETTDEDLRTIAEAMVAEGEAEGVLLDEDDCYDHAEWVRDRLREEDS